MALRRLAKDPDSANGGCPTVYADDTPIAHEGLVLQGNVAGYASTDAPRASSTGAPVPEHTVAWRSIDGATVMVQGTPLTAERASELENVLPNEAAVPVSREVLYAARPGGAPLPGIAAGQVRLTIKSSIVDAARAADHGDAS